MQFNSQSWETEDWGGGVSSLYEKKNLAYNYSSLDFGGEIVNSIYIFEPAVREGSIGPEDLTVFLPARAASSQLTSLMAG
jgi:hypothetical protein